MPCQPVILSYGGCRLESYFSLDANELFKTRIVLYDRLNTFLLLLLQQKSKLLPRVLEPGSWLARGLGAVGVSCRVSKGERERGLCERERLRESLKRGREEGGWGLGPLLTAEGGGGRGGSGVGRRTGGEREGEGSGRGRERDEGLGLRGLVFIGFLV